MSEHVQVGVGDAARGMARVRNPARDAARVRVRGARRRRRSGPWPVRPRVVPTSSGPARPLSSGGGGGTVVARTAGAARPPRRGGVAQEVAKAVLVVVLAATVVVALGLLADASAERASASVRGRDGSVTAERASASVRGRDGSVTAERASASVRGGDGDMNVTRLAGRLNQ